MLTLSDLENEMRHKYLIVLKSVYWEQFENGRSTPSTVFVLIESADRSLDHENEYLHDWKFLEEYFMNDQLR